MNLRVLILVAMITAFAPLSMDLYLPGLPDLRNDLGATDTAARLTVSGCILGLACGQLVTGLLPDRLGRKQPLAVGMVLWICATIVCALAPNIWVITGSRVAQGLGAGVAIALARTVIADLDPRHLAEHLSRMMMVLSVIPILAPAIGGLALSWTSWRGLFLGLAVTGLLLLVVVRRYLPESHVPTPSPQQPGGLRQLVGLARTPAFLVPAVVSGAGFGVLFSYISDSPFVFRDHYDLGPAPYGLLFGACATTLICGFQVGPILKRRWGVRPVLLTATAVGAVAGVAIVVNASLAPGSVVPVVLSLMLVLASAGVVIPLATAAAIDAHPHHVAAASGLSGALQFLLGGTLATLPVALDLGDGAAPLGMTSAACLVGGWLLVRFVMVEPAARAGQVVIPVASGARPPAPVRPPVPAAD